MRLQIILLAGLFFCVSLGQAEEEETKSNKLEGELDGLIERSDGTRLTAKYTISYNDDDVASLLIQDEENNTYVFESIAIGKEKISFLWNPENEDSRCELLLDADSLLFEAECMVFQEQSVKLIMSITGQYTEKED